MDNLLLIILAGFGVALALTFLRPTPQPPIVYVVTEPQPSGGLGCLLPLIVGGIIILFLASVIR